LAGNATGHPVNEPETTRQAARSRLARAAGTWTPTTGCHAMGARPSISPMAGEKTRRSLL
jgi:hypothetical protein